MRIGAQSIEEIGLEKRGYRDPAALHEHASEAARTQQSQHLDGFVTRCAVVDAGDGGAFHVGLARRHPRSRADVQRRDRPIGEDTKGRRQPSSRIDHDPERVRSGDTARRELGIVGRHGAGADDDRVAQGTHAVHVHDVVAAGDELRVARRRRDEPVEALAEMADREGTHERRAADRQIEIQELGSRIARWQPGLPSGSRAPCENGVGAVGRQEAEAMGLVLTECTGTALPLEPVGQDARRAKQAPGGIRCRPVLLEGCCRRLGNHGIRAL